MFTTGLREFKEIKEKTTSAVDEALMKNKMPRVQYIIAHYQEVSEWATKNTQDLRGILILIKKI